jgi:carbonic anhydrase
MKNVERLLKNNREWSESISRKNPEFFTALAEQQTPEFLWIGCSDSRVPATQLVGLSPGDVFVHRNVANQVIHTDLNCLSVLQYAVDVLHVRHIIVVGHYGCGGVKAVVQNLQLGLIDNWLRHVQDIMEKHEAILRKLNTEEARINKLCELNVIEQVNNVCQTTVVQSAWERQQFVAVHGWIYGLKDGLLRDLKTHVTNRAQTHKIYRAAVAGLL